MYRGQTSRERSDKKLQTLVVVLDVSYDQNGRKGTVEHLETGKQLQTSVAVSVTSIGPSTVNNNK